MLCIVNGHADNISGAFNIHTQIEWFAMPTPARDFIATNGVTTAIAGKAENLIRRVGIQDKLLAITLFIIRRRLVETFKRTNPTSL